jgi:nitrate/nitrite transport system ATP-binding protein
MMTNGPATIGEIWRCSWPVRATAWRWHRMRSTAYRTAVLEFLYRKQAHPARQAA